MRSPKYEARQAGLQEPQFAVETLTNLTVTDTAEPFLSDLLEEESLKIGLFCIPDLATLQTLFKDVAVGIERVTHHGPENVILHPNECCELFCKPCSTV